MNQLIGYLSEGEQLKGSLTIPQQLGGSTLGSKIITANDTYYAEDDGYDGYSEVTVNVSGGGGGTLETITKTYTPTTSQQTEQITPSSGYDGIAEVDVTVNAIPSQYIIPTGTKSISSNGTEIDVKAYEYADVAVPNSYSAADEGKVVSSGALVAQTADTVTTNDTYDTTLINSLTVNVSGGPSGYESGTYIGAGSGNQIREISVSKKWSHFLIVADNTFSQLTSDTTINLYMAYGDEYGYTLVPLKTADGGYSTNQVQNKLASSYDNWRSQLTFTDSKIKWAFMGNGAIATPINGATYRWFAW